MIFISPPFGNYLAFKDYNTISIQGSYTLYPRPGLWSQVFKTLRYSFEHGGWINKIGLRNPGIDVAISRWKLDTEKSKHSTIYSVAILDEKEIPDLVDKIPNSMNLELNLSCPNAEKPMVVTGIHQFLHPDRKWCIVKLSPDSSEKKVDRLYLSGFRQFHCSNTIKTPNGGLSGRSLRPHTTRLVKYIREKYPKSVIIAGGGVENLDDVKYYQDIGADHVSVSTIWFQPWIAWKLIYDFNKNTNK